MDESALFHYHAVLYRFNAAYTNFEPEGETQRLIYEVQFDDSGDYPRAEAVPIQLTDKRLVNSDVSRKRYCSSKTGGPNSFYFPIFDRSILPLSPTFFLVYTKRNKLEDEENLRYDKGENMDELGGTTGSSDCFALKFVDESTAVGFYEQYNIRLKKLKSKGAHEDPLDIPAHLNKMDTAIVQTYFQYYGKMANQMNMLQDDVRTAYYQRAVHENKSDFYNKVVMDVGAGSGILSFFAAQAGAKKVYAVEASSIAESMKILLDSNPRLCERIKLVASTVENIPDSLVEQKVDVLISEPIGIFLFNERMIESYLYARDKYLHPNGKMFPSKCMLALAPFSDQPLYAEMKNRCHFWTQNNFYGVDLSSAARKALHEQFRQPIVDYIDPCILVAPPHLETFDLRTIKRDSLQHLFFTFQFLVKEPTLVHGLAGWFDMLCEGSEKTLGFSTSPWSAPTHWYQIRFLLKSPLAVNAAETICGSLEMTANEQQSYYVSIKMQIKGTSFTSESINIDLKDPDYRYYTSSSSYIPPQNTPVCESTPQLS